MSTVTAARCLLLIPRSALLFLALETFGLLLAPRGGGDVKNANANVKMDAITTRRLVRVLTVSADSPSRRQISPLSGAVSWRPLQSLEAFLDGATKTHGNPAVR